MNNGNQLRKSRISDEEFTKAVLENISIASALKAMGLNKTGSAYHTIRKRSDELGLDRSHWLGQGQSKGKKLGPNPVRASSDIFVEHSTYNSGHNLKRRIFQEKLLENKCSVCGLTDWQEKSISLQLDHINGIHDDNRIENLRIICPNCHSQTETFAGKNIGKQFGKKTYPSNAAFKGCEDCGTKVYRNSTHCRACSQKRLKLIRNSKPKFKRATKIEWPETSVLVEKIKTSNYLAVSRALGVSDNAIRKRIKSHPVKE